MLSFRSIFPSLLLAWPCFLAAQEVKYNDISHVHPRTELRHLQHRNQIVKRARIVLGLVMAVAASEMALLTSATRMPWESTCCGLHRRTLTQPSHSKSSSKFLTAELHQSSCRSLPICPTSNRTMSQWPDSSRSARIGEFGKDPTGTRRRPASPCRGRSFRVSLTNRHGEQDRNCSSGG
jgi:hypothetical protein